MSKVDRMVLVWRDARTGLMRRVAGRVCNIIRTSIDNINFTSIDLPGDDDHGGLLLCHGINRSVTSYAPTGVLIC